jgi:hypothetical protein
MLSQSANDLCISILLHSEDAEILLKVLHRSLIEDLPGLENNTHVFGPVWKEIQDR